MVDLRRRALEAEARYLEAARERDAAVQGAQKKYQKALSQAVAAQTAARGLARSNAELLEGRGGKVGLP